MKSCKPLFFGLILAVAFLSSPVLAATYYVPDDFSTIQGAVNSVDTGDEVIVRDGTYVENLDFIGKAITVRSENGSATTTIDGNASGSVVTFVSGENSTSVLEGFTITNGFAAGGAHGGGIYCSNSSPTINDCTISYNTSESGYGGGIYCNYSSPVITGCTISENTSFDNGGGIYCYYSPVAMTNCTISDNTAQEGFGGAIQCLASSIIVTDCIINDNSSYWYGGGIAIWDSPGAEVAECTITGNTVITGPDQYSAYGGGISVSSNNLETSWPTISGCTIANNTANAMGGGIYCQHFAAPQITNCNIIGNSTLFMHGGGVANFVYAAPEIINCTIAANESAYVGGGIACLNLSSPTVTNSILWGNSAVYGDKEISLEADCSISVTYSDVDGSWPGAGNINANPLFIGSGDYHLAPGSPCIDSGTDAGIYIDIEGEIRPNGDGFDMGSDEYYSSGPPAISLSTTLLTTSCATGSDASSQTFQVWNSGGETLNYSVSDEADWLYCSPDTGSSIGESDTITVHYLTSGLGVGDYSATITMSDPAASNNPQTISVELTVIQMQLTQINLDDPPDGGYLLSAPVFAWISDGSPDCVYALDLSIPTLVPFWSTHNNLGILLHDTTLPIPDAMWNMIPRGWPVYWRVRGADPTDPPVNVIVSDEVWFFYRP